MVLLKTGRSLRHGLLLAFSGAFLLTLTLLELLPQAYESGKPRTVGIFIAIGILLQIVLEYFSKGAEHGHVHGISSKAGFPWLLFGSLCIHAFLEGIPLELSHEYMLGIVVHKIPVALILGGFLLRSHLTQLSVWIFMGVFAIMTPLGALFGGHPSLLTVYPLILALVIGVVLHVSTVILFESSEEHTVNIRKLGMILLGMALAFVI